MRKGGKDRERKREEWREREMEGKRKERIGERGREEGEKGEVGCGAQSGELQEGSPSLKRRRRRRDLIDLLAAHQL